MSGADRAIGAAYAAFSRGDLDGARCELRGRGDGYALHLLGLVEKRAGDLSAARALLDRAAKALPRDPEVAQNRGQLARLQGDADTAATEFRRALELRPGFEQAQLGLGRALLDQHRYADAVAQYEDLLTKSPQHVAGRYGLATARLGLSEPEAAEPVFDQLLRETGRPEIRFMRARARMELGQADEALEDFRAAHAAAPTLDTLKGMAGMLWMQDDREGFGQLIRAALADPRFAVAAVDILRQCGDSRQALEAIRAFPEQWHRSAEMQTVAALASVDAGDAVAAESAARACLAIDEGNRVATAALVSALLMQGRANDALAETRRMRQLEPLRQHWIAYEATALGLLGSEDLNRLVDPERFIRAYTLPIPPGYKDLDAFNVALAAALTRWHVSPRHPLDQSLRGGSQTPRDLTSIDDPAIAAYVAALDKPIRQYMADVGQSPGHPLTSRNNGDYRIAGCWSVRLTAAGRHMNHVHPEGWISSSYYVSVPPGIASDAGRRGWIKFGEPPFRTRPASEPFKWICPAAGMVVLFPSFCWHGTEPVGDGAVRMTAPFDVVPVP